MKLRFEKRVMDLLEGSIDMHIHSAPDVYPRILNDVELAVQAKEMGMRAIVIKNHFLITADRAQVATDAAEFPGFGGIASDGKKLCFRPHTRGGSPIPVSSGRCP